MVRIVNLERAGLYVVMRGGQLTTLGGRCYWPDPMQARDAARRENMPVCDAVLRTLP